MKKRIHQIELFIKYPYEVQNEVLQRLLRQAERTEYGRTFGFYGIKNREDFIANVPIVNYEGIFPYIERLMRGEQNLLWPSEIIWFAKSSGTTNAKSKFIPVSPEALEDCHLKGGKDLISIYVNNFPETKVFTGKVLTIGGSQQINQFDKNSNSYYGDVSAVIMKNLPLWAQFVSTPSMDIALMDEWEEKIEKMARETARDNVTCISGVPTWTVVLLQRILELEGKKNVNEVWPNLELFIHGAVAFTPYQSLFDQLIPSPGMRYLETYNASEGFFGIQDQTDSKDMLLMLDYGIYYEFIPSDEWDTDNPKTIGLDQVEVGRNYAVIITTNSGLWRYKIGDTVKFTSTSPHRIKVTGRTGHFINAFGEELIIENAESAIAEASNLTESVISNFTAGPRYLEVGQKGCHEWIVEFKILPNDMNLFTDFLDSALKKLNSDYEAKRHKNLALEAPFVHSVPEGTFYAWLKRRGRLGGQNKVPRLANNREYLEDILSGVEVLGSFNHD